jgi:20S proteasome alpha/beta subunit
LEGDKELTREKALKVLQKTMEIAYYRDCGASDEYTISFIEKDDESSLQKSEKILRPRFCEGLGYRLTKTTNTSNL